MEPSPDRMPVTVEVDVVVVVRNGVDTIGAALDSIAGTGDEVVEGGLRCALRILVIDGDSTDGSAEVASTRPGVRVVTQLGDGLGDARNQGVAAGDAEFLAFLDADDLWPAGSLRLRVAHLLAHPEADAVIGHFEVFTRSGELPARFDHQDGRRVLGLTPGAMVCRRRVFDRIGPFSTDLSIGTDTDWFSRAIDAGLRIDQLDAVVLRKGIGASNLSHSSARYSRELLTVVREHLRRTRT